MIEIYKIAESLPAEWDAAAGNNFALCKDSLSLLEEVNSCNQTYVIFKNGGVCSILVHYNLKLNIFCYSSLKLDFPVTVVGVPCSVCEPGYSLEPGHMEEAYVYMSSLKGAKLVLNSSEDLGFPGFAKGYTLPSCIMNICWNSFDEYMDKLRSHYRYRYKKAVKKAERLTVQSLKGGFTERHYSLYEQVYNKSLYKLEKLPVEYFRKSTSQIAEFMLDEEPVAFVQYAVIGGAMFFLFGGLNYDLNKKYDLYINMLLYLVRAAIENNCTLLNLGQTAEEIKCRLGAFQQEKYLYINHSNPIINKLGSVFKGAFSYKMKNIDLTVLKG